MTSPVIQLGCQRWNKRLLLLLLLLLNGVGIMLKEDLVEEVIEVKRLYDRMMKIAMVCGKKILYVLEKEKEGLE